MILGATVKVMVDVCVGDTVIVGVVKVGVTETALGVFAACVNATATVSETSTFDDARVGVAGRGLLVGVAGKFGVGEGSGLG